MNPHDLFELSGHDYDWREAFKCIELSEWLVGETGDARCVSQSDVHSVIAHHVSYGEYAETTCRLLAKLKDGAFWAIDASCDTTGWDCQAGGRGLLSMSLPRLIQLGLTADERRDLNATAPFCIVHDDCAMSPTLGHACRLDTSSPPREGGSNG